jgi:transcription elongation factor Elf1
LGKAKVACSICGLTAELPVSPSSQPVDIYCQFSDLFYARKLA